MTAEWRSEWPSEDDGRDTPEHISPPPPHGDSHPGDDDDTDPEYELDDLEDERFLQPLMKTPAPPPQWYPVWWRPSSSPFLRRSHPRSHYPWFIHPPSRSRSTYWYIAQFIVLFTYGILASVVVTGLCFPSYSNPPDYYTNLRRRVTERGETANGDNEKIFIAASLYDPNGELLSGAWADAVVHLVDILGRGNVFLSIYENNPDEQARVALDSFTSRVNCDHAIVSEDLDYADFPHIALPDGTHVLKRMVYLADVRNRALRPLDDLDSAASSTQFDKVLYLNDVIFDPLDAANLLFSTNLDPSTGKAQYTAACAVDFINPFKFYDTFATRDLQGYDMGVPFYPWFSSGGLAQSRQDVLDQKDAVRVKSCWGGMVAFDAKWFQTGKLVDLDHDPSKPHPVDVTAAAHPSSGAVRQRPSASDLAIRSSSASSLTSPTAPLRFRAEPETFWDSSECCLIHADLASLAAEPGIYLNPYIRVAYSSAVFPWLAFTRRFEKLYPPIHAIANWIARRPSSNPRQFDRSGENVNQTVWLENDDGTGSGGFAEVERVARPGGFCGMQKLFYINENPREGEAKWWKIGPPGAGR